MRPSKLGTTLLAALLAGCASTPRTAAARLEFDPASCAASIAELPVTPVLRLVEPKAKPPRPLQFDQIAGCLRAGDGAAFPLAVFELDQQVPTELRVELHIRGEVAFAAAVDLLDGEHRLLGQTRFGDFVRRADAYTGSIFLNADDAAARYLVLRPDAAVVGQAQTSVAGRTNTTTIGVVAGGALYFGTFRTGSDVLTRTWLSELGEFRIWSRPYAPAPVAGSR